MHMTSQTPNRTSSLILVPLISATANGRPTPRLRRGFSVLELVVVLMIGGVIASMSAGRVNALMTQQRVVHAATAIQNDLEAAFQIAGRNRKPVLISWEETQQQFNITDRTGTISYRRIKLGQQAYGFAKGAVTVSDASIEVYPNGLAESPLVITISSHGVTKKLRMSRAGLVQII